MNTIIKKLLNIKKQPHFGANQSEWNYYRVKSSDPDRIALIRTKQGRYTTFGKDAIIVGNICHISIILSTGQKASINDFKGDELSVNLSMLMDKGYYIAIVD